MADFRNIHTRIWKDAWFSELDTDAKLLFIYLFSNERASVCGMYELPLKYIVFETGISKDRVSAILASFEQADKAYYRDGIVWVVNLRKYNDSGDSIKVRTRADKDLASIPDCELKRLYYGRLNIPYPQSEIPYPQNKSETEKIQKGEDTDTSPQPLNIFTLYEHEIGHITPTIAEKLELAEQEYPPDWFVEAFKEAATNNKRSWAYAETILKRWKVDGFKVDKRNGNHQRQENRNKPLPKGV